MWHVKTAIALSLLAELLGFPSHDIWGKNAEKTRLKLRETI
jgi:hypothetical protein